jgi:FkbM family methyltransferase
MSIVSYAQNFEDVMLWRALGHISKGYYIDVGAQDPVVDSVSLAFYEKGWRGLHVEPTPNYAELLRQQRPGDTVVQAAIANGPVKIKFFEIPQTGISTADASIAEQHRQRGFDVHEISVHCVPLSEIFKSCASADIHWLKIDVEGFEAQVLASWGQSKTRPWIVVVESTLPLTQTQSHASWEPMLLGYGYEPVYFDGLNRYYLSVAHLELRGAFATPPNVFDGFTLNGTASAPFHRLLEERHKAELTKLATQNTDEETWLRIEKKLVAGNETTQQALEKLLLSQEDRTQEIVNLQIEYTQRLQVKQEELARIEDTHKKNEFKLGEQILAAQVQTENLLRAQLQREQDIAEQLFYVQQEVVREKHELVHHHKNEIDSLHNQNTKQKQELQQYVQQIADLSQKLDNTIKVAAQRECDLKEQTQADRLQFDEQIRTFAEREHALRINHEKSEATVLQRLNSSEQLRLKISARYDAIESAFSQERTSYVNDLKQLASIVAKQNSALVRRQSSLWQRYFSPFNTFRQSLETEQKMNIGSITTMQSVYQIAYQPVFKVKSDGIYELDDFQHLYDRNFVHAVYVSILRREPDKAGEAYYLERIRKGVSKNKILAQFQKSSEAKKHKTYIAGLKAAIAIESLCNLPVVGHMVIAILFLSNIKNHLQDLRALENHMVRMAEETQLTHQNDIAKIRSTLMQQK